MPLYQFPINFNCSGVVASKSTYCLPLREDCTPNPEDGIYTQPGNEFNNNLCPVDKCYFMPFFPGDLIQFQTVFLDDGRDAPTAYGTLLTVTLLDGSGEVISTDVGTFASRLLSGWTGSYNYQILELDTTGLDCFQLRFETADQVIITEMFQKIRVCSDTLTIRSTYTGKDCNHFWYAEPEAYTGDLIEYDNSLRYYAFLKVDGDTIQKERFAQRATSVSLENYFTITMAGLVPAYVKRLLINTHLAGERVYIDDQEYQFDDVSIDPIKNSGNMTHFEVRAKRECNVKYNCN